MSLVTLAHNKDAVGFQKALHERIEAKVGEVLAEAKIAIANMIFENPNGIVTDAEDGEKTIEQGGLVGKNRLPDTTNIKSSAPGSPPGGTKLAHVETKPGTHLAVNPTLPGGHLPPETKIGEEVDKPGHNEKDKKRGDRIKNKMKEKTKRERREANEGVQTSGEPVNELSDKVKQKYAMKAKISHKRNKDTANFVRPVNPELAASHEKEAAKRAKGLARVYKK